jgi:hypothetical protein
MANAGFMLFDPAASLGSVTRHKSFINLLTSTLGFSIAFGIFQEYYTTHDVLQGSKGDLATVGTTSTVCKKTSHIWTI